VMVIPFATPVMAVTNSVGVDLRVVETTIPNTGIVHYQVILKNEAVSGSHAATVSVTFFPPGPTGADGAYGTGIPVVSSLSLGIGDEYIYSYDGQAVDITNSAANREQRTFLGVDLSTILNPGVTGLVYADVTFTADYSDPSYEASGHKNVPVTVTQPPPPPTQTPASSTLGVVLMIAVLGGLVTFFLVRRNRRSQLQSILRYPGML
jgi:hypothetical protein